MTVAQGCAQPQVRFVTLLKQQPAIFAAGGCDDGGAD
jgi:hypothetical protein